jgi:hypothetical protein
MNIASQSRSPTNETGNMGFSGLAPGLSFWACLRLLQMIVVRVAGPSEVMGICAIGFV